MYLSFCFRDIGGEWKPVQTAIITTTQSIIDLQKLLIDSHGFSVVLTARFSQDSLGTIFCQVLRIIKDSTPFIYTCSFSLPENLFSVIRRKWSDPGVREFLYCLKIVTISQYIREVKSSCKCIYLDFFFRKSAENIRPGSFF